MTEIEAIKELNSCHAYEISSSCRDLAKDALEKQIPKKIEKSGYVFMCPICHIWLQSAQEYCHGCGQKINWH